MNMDIEGYLSRWNLTRDGDAFTSMNGVLVPVRRGDVPAMLKISHETEELAGIALMVWWDGDGAAPVLAHDGEGLLMARALGPASLVRMTQSGRDDDATRIICSTIARLHRPRAAPSPHLVPLTRWFAALLCGTANHHGIIRHAADAARVLLSTPHELVVLHGDVHHGNVLDFGPSGWLAIDPKGLRGEPGFDYANLFCNPDHTSASACFAQRLEIVVRVSGIERGRLLSWILAWTGLSAVWMIEDGHDPAGTLDIGLSAAAALGIAI